MSAEPVPPDEYPDDLGHRVPAVKVPVIAAIVYLDAPRGTLEAIREWRRAAPQVGRRELLVRLVEVDGMWEETVLQEAQAPPQPLPRRVIRRRG